MGIDQANGFKTHNELTMYPLGNYPLAPSVMRLQVQEQLDCSKAPLEYEGRLALDPILMDRARLFGALEAGAFELANTRTHQNLVLHHLGLAMTESAIFLRELTGMVGRPYRIAVMEELSTGELARVILACQGIATREEVMEDEETGVISTIEVLDLTLGARDHLPSGYIVITL